MTIVRELTDRSPLMASPARLDVDTDENCSVKVPRVECVIDELLHEERCESATMNGFRPRFRHLKATRMDIRLA